MFSMSEIKEQELLMGRPYGGCSIFINKTLGYNSIFVETENTRVCSVLSKFDTTTMIFICVYMPNDINSNIYIHIYIYIYIYIYIDIYCSKCCTFCSIHCQKNMRKTASAAFNKLYIMMFTKQMLQIYTACTAFDKL